jgi:formate hydrogenlyase subunit 3/multisubunit Na+/H+ antiporter MnhD subunit
MEKTEDEKVAPPIPNITMVGMVVAIVVSAVICFVIGLIVHNLYRKHRKKRVSLTTTFTT